MRSLLIFFINFFFLIYYFIVYFDLNASWIF